MNKYLLQNMSTGSLHTVEARHPDAAIKFFFSINKEYKKYEFTVYELRPASGVYGIPPPPDPCYLRPPTEFIPRNNTPPLNPPYHSAGDEQDSSKMPDLPGLYPDVVPTPKSSMQLAYESDVTGDKGKDRPAPDPNDMPF